MEHAQSTPSSIILDFTDTRSSEQLLHAITQCACFVFVVATDRLITVNRPLLYPFKFSAFRPGFDFITLTTHEKTRIHPGRNEAGFSIRLSAGNDLESLLPK